jgi:hypothetical protein
MHNLTSFGFKSFKRLYLEGLLEQPAWWIRGSMLDPSPSMLRRPVTIALHAIALRRLGDAPATRDPWPIAAVAFRSAP